MKATLFAGTLTTAKNRSVKGINFVSCLYQNIYQNQEITVPVGFELVKKTEKYFDQKTEKEKRRALRSKNLMAREMMLQVVKNQVVFSLILFDVWFTASENLMFIKQELEKDFICPLKENRKVARSFADKKAGRWRAVSTLELKPIPNWKFISKPSNFRSS